MFDIYTRLTVDHDWRLVALAAGVCLLASSVAISLFHRAQAANGRAQLGWVVLDGAAAGCGIWATHFIAMLAYAPSSGSAYSLYLTFLSLLIAMLITGAGFGLALLDRNRALTVLGGAIVGGGIAAMHYTGMMALEVSGRIVWSPTLVATSIIFGTVFSVAAIIFSMRSDSWANATLAVALLTLGILATHFTGMTAVTAIANPTVLLDSDTLSPAVLSLVVAGATAVILGMCLVAALSDRRFKGTLLQQKYLLDTALENMSQGLCMFDADGRVMLANECYVQMTGLPEGSIHGRTLLELLSQRKASGHFADDPQKQFDQIMSAMRGTETHTRHVMVRDRTLRVVEAPRPNGGWIATFEDVTEWLVTQERISHMAHHDALTDLANRTQLVDKLSALFVDGVSQESIAALHFIDIDRFKTVNDTLGHDGGDFLLKTIAERLRSVTRAEDIVARLGGDEFVVVQAHVASKEKAEEFARRLSFAILAPIMWRGQTIVASVSVGVSIAPADGGSPERLLKSADLALYKAKADGRNRIRFFEPDMDTELQARTKLERTLRDAVANENFEVHYQPLFDMTDKRLVGFEALVRMHGDDGELIAPLAFIALAEELQLIDKIGGWVLREACRTAMSWPDGMTVAVNLSPAQFAAGDLCGIVADALHASGLAANRLELEITESLLLGESSGNMEQLRQLKALGVAIVMDDFGTGYSSLSYLWKFPFDKIKIDRSFMEDFDGSGHDARTVVKTLMALGRELKMRVTVEGIETATQAAFLENAAGDQAQGYFFGRPMPASEIGASILANFRRNTLALPRPAGTNAVVKRAG
jgi:diguanylate cyclase (GGDEF)-like protein